MRASVRAICTVLIVTAVAPCGNSSAADPVTCGWDNGIFDSVPPPIGNPATVWTGSQLFVWGRRDVGPAVGWLYDPVLDSWQTMTSLGSLPLADDDQDQIALLPPTVSGSVMIRVIDTDRTPGSRDLDSVSIDELFLRSVP